MKKLTNLFFALLLLSISHLAMANDGNIGEVGSDCEGIMDGTTSLGTGDVVRDYDSGKHNTTNEN